MKNKGENAVDAAVTAALAPPEKKTPRKQTKKTHKAENMTSSTFLKLP